MHSTCAEAIAELRAVLTTPVVPEVRRTLSQIRPELCGDSLEFRAALLLLTGPAFSFNIDRLACRTQIPRNVVAACTRRLFDNGVWQPDGPVYAWRAPDDPQFWNDVGVAEGRLCRRADRLGRIEWARAGAWRKAYEIGTADDESLTVAYSSHSMKETDEAGAAPSAIPLSEAKEVRLPMRPRPERARRAQFIAPLVAVPVVAARGAPVGQTKKDLFPGADWLS